MKRKPSFEQELAAAAALFNSFRMVREDAERKVSDAEARRREAVRNETEAYARLFELIQQAEFRPVSPRA